MKKIKFFALLAALVLPLGFAACSSDDDDDKNNNMWAYFFIECAKVTISPDLFYFPP